MRAESGIRFDSLNNDLNEINTRLQSTRRITFFHQKCVLIICTHDSRAALNYTRPVAPTAVQYYAIIIIL